MTTRSTPDVAADVAQAIAAATRDLSNVAAWAAIQDQLTEAGVTKRKLISARQRVWRVRSVLRAQAPEQKIYRATLQRIQLRRTKGWRMPADGRKCDRTTDFGNPFVVKLDNDGGYRVWHGDAARSAASKLEAQAAAVRLYEDWIDKPEQAQIRERIRAEFKTQRPACWCAIGTPCHGDVIAFVAATSGEPPETLPTQDLIQPQ